jgi:hypothetical protein
LSETETEIWRWRHDYAKTLGYSEQRACELAHDHALDLHDLEALVRPKDPRKRPCEPELALRILR